MSSLFNNLKKYEESWKVVATDVLDAEDMTLIRKAEVVKSTYGTSVKFHVEEGSFFIPIDERDTHYSIGDEVDLSRIIVKTLHKDGEPKDIQRVIFKDEDTSVAI